MFYTQHVNFDAEQEVAMFKRLLQAYAKDPMGGGEAIAEKNIEALPALFKTKPHLRSILLLNDSDAVGITNIIESFSSFYAAPVLNIHDFYIAEAVRGQNLSHLLLDAIEAYAKKIGACKLTLEVLQGNEVAKYVYKKFGFEAYRLAEDTGIAEFWQKPL